MKVPWATRFPATLDSSNRRFLASQLDESLDLDQMGRAAGNTRVSDINHSSSFVQPWLGLAGAVYPWEDWRFQVEGMVEGFGVSRGSWGWGASALLTWAANDWLNLSAGYRALHTGRDEPPSTKNPLGQRDCLWTRWRVSASAFDRVRPEDLSHARFFLRRFPATALGL